jgi:non-specific protein-tyrosine kinase
MTPSGKEVTEVEARRAPVESVAADDEPLELARYGRALKRNWLLILAIVVPLTALVLVFSLLIPKSYRATARLVLAQNAGAFPSSDVETRQLATLQTLVTTRSVLATAASKLRGESVTTLERNVKASVDPNANILDISATNRVPHGAATTANAVAETFLAQQRDVAQNQLALDRANVVRMLRRLRGTPANVAELRALQARLSEIGVEQASATSDLQLAEPAIPPASPFSPRPIRNAVFAFFAATFLAVLAALARENLVRRPAGPRELSRLLQVPILSSIPSARATRGRPLRRARGSELEAYDALTAALEFQLGNVAHDSLLVASAVPGEGASEVTARLGEALAEAGRSTLLVDANLRRPKLHEFFDLPTAPGFLDLLGAAQAPSDTGALAAAADRILAESRVADRLSVIPIGDASSRRLRRLGRDGAEASAVLREVSQRGYDYVLVDGPPLLGMVEAQILAQLVDAVLVVARIDHLTVDNVHDLRDVLDRSEIDTVGVVAVGVQSTSFPYYLDSRDRTLALEDSPRAGR